MTREELINDMHRKLPDLPRHHKEVLADMCLSREKLLLEKIGKEVNVLLTNLTEGIK